MALGTLVRYRRRACMGTQFGRQYRAALLDYVLNDTENGLERAHALGRRAVEAGIGLLQVVSIHHEEINATIEAARVSDDFARYMHSAQRFLLDALAPFDMTHRGYMDRVAGPAKTG